jgi:hypothetical protein
MSAGPDDGGEWGDEQHGEWDRAATRHRSEVERASVVYMNSTPCCLYYLWLLGAFFLALFLCDTQCIPGMDATLRYGMLVASALTMCVLGGVWWSRRAEISGRLAEGRALWRELWRELKQLRRGGERLPRFRESDMGAAHQRGPARYVVDEDSGGTDDSEHSGSSTTDSDDDELEEAMDPLRLRLRQRATAANAAAEGGGGAGGLPHGGLAFVPTVPLPPIGEPTLAARGGVGGGDGGGGGGGGGGGAKAPAGAAAVPFALRSSARVVPGGGAAEGAAAVAIGGAPRANVQRAQGSAAGGLGGSQLLSDDGGGSGECRHEEERHDI